ncbi:MAG: hypothetical protein D6766_06430 [Verrucomicrobia bacterium]|nr:MAG: hypothetical protein D6766_06430 [Verrucomicrobiota bacterium]
MHLDVMKRIAILLGCGLGALGLQAGPNTLPVYVNRTSVTNVPQIDAYAFANFGQFVVTSPNLPYDFQNVLRYTNANYMSGFPGFRFDHVDDLGVRGPAEFFLNDVGALIEAQSDPFLPFTFGGAPGIIRIEADQIINRGDLAVDASGSIVIRGREVDLRRGSVGVSPIIFGSGFQSTTNFWPDEGITDEHWGMGVQDPRFASSTIVQSFLGSLNALAPAHRVTNVLGALPPFSFPLPNPMAFIRTNEIDPTNWTVQALLVARTDPFLNLQAAFFPSSDPSNDFHTITLQMQADLTNNLGGFRDSIASYLVDRLASETNFALLTNELTGNMPYRPSTYEFTRNMPLEFAAGDPPNANVFRTNLADLIYNQGYPPVTNVITNVITTPESNVLQIITNVVTVLGYTHDVVTNIYAGYAARITNLVNEIPDLPGSGSTNAQGKVVIDAENLNLERTRLRGEGNITISAKHLVSTKLLSVDSPNLLYFVRSTNGVMELQNLAPPEVQRYAGSILAWSGVWTNFLLVETNSITNATITNIVDDPDLGPTEVVTNDPGTNVVTTNTIRVRIHVMMVDAAAMQTRYPTMVAGLHATSTNVFIADPTRVVTDLMFESENLHIGPNGEMILGVAGTGAFVTTGTITDWNAEHFPSLVRLTNEGVIAVTDEINMGGDRAEPYDRIEISGTNSAAAHLYVARDFVNRGLITSGPLLRVDTNTFIGDPVGPIELRVDRLTMDGGRIDSGGELLISARDVKLRRSTNTAVRNIILDVTDSLSDSGPDAEVSFETQLGVQLRRKPAQGDLLGTSIRLSAPQYQMVSSTWAAEDRGPTPEGFVNNVALGRLIIDPALDALVELRGASGGNGLYVDFLEFSPNAQADLANSLLVDPSLTVYFADANVNLATLTNLFPGRLVWVAGYAGANSGVDVALPTGQVIRVNRQYRESTVIDSDADGTANAFDLSPFDGVLITDFAVADGRIRVTWRAAAHTTYRIESAGELPAYEWEVVREYRHEGDDVAEVTVEDVLPEASQRFYRVTYTPGL